MLSKQSKLQSSLFDESTFYKKFLQDLSHCAREIIIESPYITIERTELFIPIFENLIQKGVKIYIVTRDPKEHSEMLEIQAEQEISYFEEIGVQVLLCLGNHHRKLAMLDRKVLWEGSLNILSQTHSREIMRRIEGEELALEMFSFLKLENYL